METLTCAVPDALRSLPHRLPRIVYTGVLIDHTLFAQGPPPPRPAQNPIHHALASARSLLSGGHAKCHTRRVWQALTSRIFPRGQTLPSSSVGGRAAPRGRHCGWQAPRKGSLRGRGPPSAAGKEEAALTGRPWATGEGRGASPSTAWPASQRSARQEAATATRLTTRGGGPRGPGHGSPGRTWKRAGLPVRAGASGETQPSAGTLLETVEGHSPAPLSLHRCCLGGAQGVSAGPGAWRTRPVRQGRAGEGGIASPSTVPPPAGTRTRY